MDQSIIASLWMIKFWNNLFPWTALNKKCQTSAILWSEDLKNQIKFNFLKSTSPTKRLMILRKVFHNSKKTRNQNLQDKTNHKRSTISTISKFKTWDQKIHPLEACSKPQWKHCKDHEDFTNWSKTKTKLSKTKNNIEISQKQSQIL